MNVGDRSGMLVVVGFLGVIKKHSRCLVKCDCGKEKVLPIARFNAGRSKSCGCTNFRLDKSVPGIQNKKKHPLYKIWMGMMNRCHKPWDKNYHRYGGRGIVVTDRWHDFGNFIADMGLRPTDDLSIDRINNDGNYEPGNCRWATVEEQAGNTRKNIRIDGMCLARKCRQAGINYSRARYRVSRGENVENVVKDMISKLSTTGESRHRGEGEWVKQRNAGRSKSVNNRPSTANSANTKNGKLGGH